MPGSERHHKFRARAAEIERDRDLPMIRMKGLWIIMAVATLIIASAAFANSALNPPTGSALTFTTGQVNYPAGCDVSKKAQTSALELEIDTSSMSKLSSTVCIHIVVTNNGLQPFPIYRYLLGLNISDSSGNVVYHQYWGGSFPHPVVTFPLGGGKSGRKAFTGILRVRQHLLRLETFKLVQRYYSPIRHRLWL